ncbi:hypothetical protein [Aestuariivivens insulae]|uniref:hypothetical protein n=1 Tax=Aestuariivivens insulae TaxID=1621988 RepID=UPI001F5893FF|nr:hypothetical protein [Aestuariivivens insulae]
MKKLGYILLGFAIGAVLTYFYCPRQLEKEMKVMKPSGVISINEAKELNNNWTKYRQAAVDSAAKQQGRNHDDRSTWWALDDIENYLAYAKSQSDSLGYNMSGIRVYLGVYGSNAGQSKKNLTTMFIVPTGKKSTSEASSLNIGLQGGNEDVPVSPLNDGTGGDTGYP